MFISIKSQLKQELLSVFFGYPEFVFAGKPKVDMQELPVFVYHTIEPDIFEAQLLFLMRNGYQTLSIDDFIKRLTGKESCDQKSVLLTVDDGRSSFWRFGYPLLNKYKMKACLFIIPGRTPEDTFCRNTLFQVWEGKLTHERICKIDIYDESLCSWPEIKEMYDSGLVNIESHTLFHKEVFISPQIIDFIDFNTPLTPFNSPITGYFEIEDIGKTLDERQYYGLPIFQSAPLMEGQSALNISEEIRIFCSGFFRNQKKSNGIKKIWKKELFNQLLMMDSLKNPAYQTTSEIIKDIRKDLNTARTTIQGKLGQDAGNHLCFPYSIGSELAIQVAKELGIKSCFWGTLKGRRINKPGNDPFHISRLKNDFLWRLPGKGRKSLLTLYGMKAKRRFRNERIF